jgi:predicted double-glycine peptidase
MSQPAVQFGAIHNGGEVRSTIEDREMKTRRMAYWWFRFVVSGRFLEKFLRLRKTSQN